jgi:indole-3-glycerol phosphate synthase/phosphoribosylanthranilate isomerase
MRPLVKICGLTRPEDARLATELGASHVGCVMAQESPRCVTSQQARKIFEAAGDLVQHVLIFKGEQPETVAEVAREVGISRVQIFGMSEEQALFLENDGLTVYRVHELDAESRTLPPLMPEPTEKRPAMLDYKGGGAGKAFSWSLLGPRAPHATFIAGGVRPENLTSLLNYHPYGVDLSSGVESEPGIKDHRRLTLFFETLEKSL